MKHEVRILRRAQEDLLEIRSYIAGDSRTAAVAVVDRLLAAIEGLDEYPNRGARPRDTRLRSEGYRFLVAKPYLIFYKVRDSEIWIYRVLHGKRDYNRLL